MTDGEQDRLSWVREDTDLVERLTEKWPDWDDLGESGLATALDQKADWEGWETWSDDDKRAYLAESLNAWHPPEGGRGGSADRVAWVRDDEALVGRLATVWPGWAERGSNGLAAYLDEQAEWSGWETWSDDDKRAYLAESLDAWYGAQPGDSGHVAETQADEVTQADEKPAEEKAADELVAAGLAPEDVVAVGDLVQEVHGSAMDELQANIPKLANQLGMTPEELAEVIGDISAEEFSRTLADTMTTSGG